MPPSGVRTLTILWAAFPLSVLIQVVVAVLLPERLAPPQPTLQLVMLGTALASGIAALFVPGRLAGHSVETRSLIRWALFETVAVLGLAYLLLGGALNVYFALAAASLVALVLFRPRG